MQQNLFNIEQKIEQSTTTIAELRIPIFLPFKQIAHNSKIALDFKKSGGKISFQTSWGKVTIRGRKLLTDVHRDICDCIFSYNNKVDTLVTGEIDIYFTLTNILRRYGLKNPNANISWLKDRIEEIRDTTIEYVDNKGNSFDYNIFSNLVYIEDMKLYKVTLGKGYVKFYETQISLSYKKEVPKLLEIESSLIKAIIRWFFTHSDESKYKLSTVFEAIGARIDSMSLRMLQANKKTIKDNIHELNQFGIDYDSFEEMFYYAGNQNVSFIPSLFDLKKQTQITNKSEIRKTQITEGFPEKILIDEKVYNVVALQIDYDNNELPTVCDVIFSDGSVMKINNQSKEQYSEFCDKVFAWLNKNMTE